MPPTGTWRIPLATFKNPTGSTIWSPGEGLAGVVGDNLTGGIQAEFPDSTAAIYLDGSLTPTDQADLPGGWTPAGAYEFHWSGGAFGVNDSTIQIVLSAVGETISMVGPDPVGIHVESYTGMQRIVLLGIAGSTISISFASGNGCVGSCYSLFGSGDEPPLFDDIDGYFEGTYVVAAWTWYYNPETDHYQAIEEGDPVPPDPWVEADPDPVPLPEHGYVQAQWQDGEIEVFDDSDETADAIANDIIVEPGEGCPGTRVWIRGSGFGDGARVFFDADEAQSVVVFDQRTIFAVSPAHADGTVDITVTNVDSESGVAEDAYTYLEPWWLQTIVVIVNGNSHSFDVYVQQCTPPSDGLWILNTATNPPTAFAPPWAACNGGWYVSPASFGGSIIVICNGTPRNPRTWADISAWATGNRGMLGGSPAASCVFNNRTIYPGTGYTVGTQFPMIRVFDGSFEHELARLPPTAADGVPQAVLSMLSAGGAIYLTTFDSGTSYADWQGRAFSLNLESGVLAQIGGAFVTGEMPYALGWHMGRLWLGTNNGIGTAGKVYYLRPGIDTAWTMERDCGAGVTALRSFGGKLYVGLDGAAGVRGSVLVRDELGAYTVSDTGTGGIRDLTTPLEDGLTSRPLFAALDTADAWPPDITETLYLPRFSASPVDTSTFMEGLEVRQGFALAIGDNSIPYSEPRRIAAFESFAVDMLAASAGTDGAAYLNNGYLALFVFGSSLYASYWNPATTAISQIRKFDGTTWSTVYESTLRPFIVFFEDENQLFALAGGLSLSGALVRTEDGATWTDLTANLPESTRTLLPIVGVEVL
jgi:hypothetical protein